MPEVQVYMAAGRSDEQKKQLMLDISNAVVKNTGAPLDAVTVQIVEAPLTHKMKAGVTFAERQKK
ncbi:tautomerase [Afipia sp. P52-10]|jgi:4-oxalocrotonate tautomerase|uniref:2-hydroxymuconate tautomerase n=1 Tax=Afipia sp. P52-10 TaxID=1429916 RepID=UPI0003DF27FC|nr:2-hydroxymuconate tautomerase [Afipia sp. P52-10]ETR78482.1 tautomerase [Afipia sp. P52-10]